MDDNKLFEIFTSVLDVNKELVNLVKNTNAHLETMNISLGNAEEELFQLKDSSIKTNFLLQEMNQSLHQLNKKMAHFAEHENRIRKLEQIFKINS